MFQLGLLKTFIGCMRKVDYRSIDFVNALVCDPSSAGKKRDSTCNACCQTDISIEDNIIFHLFNCINHVDLFYD
jgi:hypothetical protein